MVNIRSSVLLAAAAGLWHGSEATAGFIFGDRSSGERGQLSALELGGAAQHTSAVTFADKYATALSELQQLESEPLCHRTAARLLVNNCQLLDGKDEATILTDSGRQIRDFVDSYAASLAICDLERGSFAIPPACAKFREHALAALPVTSRAVLHVTTREIDSCLSGLARSDSAWSTWVSYRHKSLRFCDAARVDHEKAQNVHIFQRITKILHKLANGMDQEIETRLTAVDKRAKDVVDSLDQLPPQVDELRQKLASLEALMTEKLFAGVQASGHDVQASLENSRNLQQMLGMMIQTVLNHNAEVAAAQDEAVALATQRVNDGMGLIMKTMAVALSSSASLREQLEMSRMQAVELAHKQQALETNLDSMLSISDDLSAQYTKHQQTLEESQAKSEAILGTLNQAGDSAEALQSSLPGRWGFLGSWPYLVCPAATLIMGSYGLPPSIFRNMGLIAMGELAGYIVSFTNSHVASPLTLFASWVGGQPTATPLVLHNSSPELKREASAFNRSSSHAV